MFCIYLNRVYNVFSFVLADQQQTGFEQQGAQYVQNVQYQNVPQYGVNP